MRASRMMTLLLHLQVRGQANGTELAALLEVSERTVQRDIEALAAAGIPIRSARGPAGGYRLDGGYRTRLTGVGLDEAGALAFLGLAGPAEQLGLGDLLEGARMKVWASLTGEARDRAGRTAARFHLDPVRFYSAPEPVPCLPLLADAVWRDVGVRIEYATGTREIDPMGLVLASGEWYLVARRDGQRRTYRVSRVRSVELLDRPVHRAPGYDLAEDWAEARRQLEREPAEVEVTLRIEPGALFRLRQIIPVHGQDRIPLSAAEEVELTVPFDEARWLPQRLLSFGSAIEVLAPQELRDQVAAEARAVAARYGSADGSDAIPSCRAAAEICRAKATSRSLKP